MCIYRKAAVRRGQEDAAASYAHHLSQEAHLVLTRAHVFNDSVGVHNVEGSVAEGKRPPVALYHMNRWKGRGKLGQALHSKRSDSIAVRIGTFQVIRALKKAASVTPTSRIVSLGSGRARSRNNRYRAALWLSWTPGVSRYTRASGPFQSRFPRDIVTASRRARRGRRPRLRRRRPRRARPSRGSSPRLARRRCACRRPPARGSRAGPRL